MNNHNYPHISDTKFPDLPTVDVYKYRNEYDYNRYTDSVRIKMMNVSWCGDYDNTVYFETKQKRDEWFEAQKGLVKELPTMFRLYNDGTVKVDLPIDECMDYNYVMIDYGKLPSQEHKSDQSKMFYFINNVTQESPNATTLYLSVDYWTTFINDMDISYVSLARGHAPMAETDADKYLANPIENSEYLLTADVNYGEFQRSVNTETILLNDSDMMLGFLTNADVDNPAWSGNIPTNSYFGGESQAYSAVDIVVLDSIYWEGFRDHIGAVCPQFFTTVKGIFVIPRKLLRTTTTFDFYGYTMHHVDTNSDKVIASYVLSKEKFKYPNNIANIAKLYTFPYAAIEINDFKGNTSIIKVEDTIGKLELHTMMCDIYPFLSIEAYMLGLGGNITSSITFMNTKSNTFRIGGRYYNFSTKWHIPVFAVQLTTEQNWALNSKIGADASKANTYATADTSISNAGLQVDANTAIANKSTEIASTITGYNNAYAYAQQRWNAGYSYAVQDIHAEAEFKSAGVSIATSAGKNVTNAIASVASGNPVGAVTGLINGVFDGANTAGQTAISIDAGYAATGAAVDNTAALLGEQQTQNSNLVAKQNEGVLYSKDITNGLISGTASNSASMHKGNADRSWNALHDQAMLDNPPMYGNMTGTPDIISKPFGLSYNVVTQSKNAIRQAAEQFLRYGYTLNMEWNIDTFNMMPKFTYWECDKVYCNDNGVYEGAQDMIKSILNQGTTVWRNPDEIGLVSIYTNI